jgi:hypothetical protein
MGYVGQTNEYFSWQVHGIFSPLQFLIRLSALSSSNNINNKFVPKTEDLDFPEVVCVAVNKGVSPCI